MTISIQPNAKEKCRRKREKAHERGQKQDLPCHLVIVFRVFRHNVATDRRRRAEQNKHKPKSYATEATKIGSKHRKGRKHRIVAVLKTKSGNPRMPKLERYHP